MMVQAIESVSIRLSVNVIGGEGKRLSRRIEETSGTIRQVLSIPRKRAAEADGPRFG